MLKMLDRSKAFSVQQLQAASRSMEKTLAARNEDDESTCKENGDDSRVGCNNAGPESILARRLSSSRLAYKMNPAC